MARKKKYTDQDLKEAIRGSISIRQVLLKLGMSPKGGGQYRNIRNKIKESGENTSHFLGQAHLRGKTHNWTTAIPLDNILVINSTYASGNCLKKRLIKEGVLKNKCSECGLKSRWNNKDLTLQIDHVNGNPTDHRLENLRILCPNCHSQTRNFCGKNIANGRRPKNTTQKKQMTTPIEYLCKKCGQKRTRNSKSKLCRKCILLSMRKVVDRPNKEDLKRMVGETSYCEVSRKYNVSDNAIRKWLR